MKKLTAILLLTLFVFNTIGYRLWTEYAQNKADLNFETKLDNGHYNEEDLISIKVPLNLPYQTNWKEFERVDGEISLNGKVYKYVKRKVYNDTLILVCISHQEKTKLQEKANDYFGKVNGLPGNETNKKAQAIKQLVSDYDVNHQYKYSYNFKPSSSFLITKNEVCLQQYIPLIGQPPEVTFTLA